MVGIVRRSATSDLQDVLVVEADHDTPECLCVARYESVERPGYSHLLRNEVASHLTASLDAVVCYAAEYAAAFGIDQILVDEHLRP